MYIFLIFILSIYLSISLCNQIIEWLFLGHRNRDIFYLLLNIWNILRKYTFSQTKSVTLISVAWPSWLERQGWRSEPPGAGAATRCLGNQTSTTPMDRLLSAEVVFVPSLRDSNKSNSQREKLSHPLLVPDWRGEKGTHPHVYPKGQHGNKGRCCPISQAWGKCGIS